MVMIFSLLMILENINQFNIKRLSALRIVITYSDVKRNDRHTMTI